VRVWSRLALVAFFLPVSFWAEQPASSPAPDRGAFTITNWDLTARIGTRDESLSVRGHIALRNDSPQPQREMTLQISSSLKWASIRQDGHPLRFTSRPLRSDIDHTGYVHEALITLPAPVASGSSTEVDVGYSGTVSLDTTRLAQLGMPLAVRAGTDYDRITPTFTCLRGIGHVIWFPVSIEPAVMGDANRVFELTGAWQVRHSLSSMKLRVTGDTAATLFSNSESAPQTMGEAEAMLDWPHIGIAGPVLVAGNYKTTGAASLSLAYFPAAADAAADYARAITETQPTLTGNQHRRVTLVDLPETNDATFDGDGILLLPLKTIDTKFLQLTLAYEFAHATLWSPRAWIYEGAAHFAQALMRERQDRRAAAIDFMQQRLPPLALADSGSPESVKSNSLINSSNEVFYRTKAMYVWWMLREIVGERALLDALQQYDPAADRESSYMQRLLEKTSHKDLEWFFDSWVYQDRGLPEFTIGNGYARPSLQGIYLVSATIENSGSAAAEVPIMIQTDTGEVVGRLQVPAKGKAAARIEVGSRPTEVTVNDGSVPEADRGDNTTPIKLGHE
jgi:hypothetical protein